MINTTIRKIIVTTTTTGTITPVTVRDFPVITAATRILTAGITRVHPEVDMAMIMAMATTHRKNTIKSGKNG